jgi:hypothetical protein
MLIKSFFLFLGEEECANVVFTAKNSWDILNYFLAGITT